MAITTQFRLPDVGEGLTEAEVVNWRVAVGDQVEVNDVIVEIETAKSLVELPCPAAGIVAEIHVETGQVVEVGTVLITISDQAGPAGVTASAATHGADAEDKPLVLVGTGPSAAHDRRRRLRPRHGAQPAAATELASAPEVSFRSGPGLAPHGRPLAKPPVRALAKRLGVDLRELAAELGRVITRDDVTRMASVDREIVVAAPSTRRETRVPIRGVRKAIATAMVESAFTAPHVTEWLTVDVTATMELLGRLKADRRFESVRLTPLVLVARALLLAIRRNPGINARWDGPAQEIVEFHYVNLGIAAATPRGLVVPNIKDADQLDLIGLSQALTDLVSVAREGKVTPDQMAGGTITITNIGALGVDAGTPIINPGEAAILAFGAVREMPWVVDGRVVPRQITQLALSFDHRLVDGELGSKTLVDVARILKDPAEALLYT